MSAAAGDLRLRLGQRLDSSVTDEQLDELIALVLTASKGVWKEFACRGCGEGQKVLVEVPDANRITASLERLLNQAKGKPVETTLVEFTARPLEEMTLEEVRARKAQLLARRELGTGS